MFVPPETQTIYCILCSGLFVHVHLLLHQPLYESLLYCEEDMLGFLCKCRKIGWDAGNCCFFTCKKINERGEESCVLIF